MNYFKTILVSGILCLPAIGNATSTTLDNPSTGAIHSTAGQLSTVTQLNSQSVSYITNVTIASDLGVTAADTTFNDTWHITVGNGEIASVVFQPMDTGFYIGNDIVHINGINGLLVNSNSSLSIGNLTETAPNTPYIFNVSGTIIGNLGGVYQVTTTVSAVSAVPVPAAVWLMGTAMLGLVSFGKRKKSA